MKELRNNIKLLKQTRDIKLYESMEDEYFHGSKKCNICNHSIFYYDSNYAISKDVKLYKFGKSCESVREINGNNYYLSICEDCLAKEKPKYLEMNRGRVFNTLNEITQFAFNIPEDDFNIESKNKNGRTKESFIKKHGEVEGLLKWNSYCHKQSITNTLDYKKEKYGWNEEQFNEFNKSRAVTLELCIKRHGEENGRKQFEEYCKKQQYVGCHIDYFKDKYGEEEGLKKYSEMLLKKCFNNYGVSKSSQKYFDKLSIYFKNYKVCYADLNFEYKFYLKRIKTISMLDFYIPKVRIAVEYNGDMWHANPKKYKSTDTPNPFNKNITAEEIWNLDFTRIKALKDEYNIDTIVIWESELPDPEHLAKQINNIIETKIIHL